MSVLPTSNTPIERCEEKSLYTRTMLRKFDALVAVGGKLLRAMRHLKKLFVISILALSFVGCGGNTPEPQAADATTAVKKDDVPATPPVLHTGNGHLDCTISAKENGKQKLTITQGTGLEFDVIVSPIVDGTVQTKGPEKGGAYRFTSHLAAPGKGMLAGVGPVAFEALETKVNVEMNRYQQPGGPGTPLTFTSEDMAARGIYVEFAGRAVAENGDKYAFRVTLGQPGPGSGGRVVPDGPGSNAPIAAKAVIITAPQMTVVTTTVTKLP